MRRIVDIVSRATVRGRGSSSLQSLHLVLSLGWGGWGALDLAWPWAMHQCALCIFTKSGPLSNQANVRCIAHAGYFDNSKTISTWGRKQLTWGRRQLPSPCWDCINFFLPAYCEKQPGIRLYRPLVQAAVVQNSVMWGLFFSLCVLIKFKFWWTQ